MSFSTRSGGGRLERRLLLLGALVVAFGVTPGESLGRTSARGTLERSALGTRTLTVYAVPVALQYNDFADDRARGEGHNPFGNYTTPYVPPPTNELVFGPFAGDESFIDYELYRDTGLKSSAGSAIFVCEYGFDHLSYCTATYQLDGGSLSGFGTFGFHASSYMLSVTGGTASYRGDKGTIAVSASAAAQANAGPFLANPPGADAEGQELSFALQSPRLTHAHVLSSYSFPLEQQYLDHNDDEARGDINTPFGPRLYKQCAGLGHTQELACGAALTKQAAATIDEHSNGPFPGDQVVFSFGIYGSPDRSAKIGSAALTCQYSFNRNGLCDETFQLTGGTLTAVGVVNFDAKSFTLAVTGGDGAYTGETGDLSEMSGPNKVQHLSFALLR